jgi:adenine phosphoribosyltransferase
VEVKGGKGKVVVIDDVLATGGTLKASAEVLTLAGYEVVGFAVLMNLKFLNQFSWNSLTAKSLIEISK